MILERIYEVDFYANFVWLSAGQTVMLSSSVKGELGQGHCDSQAR